MTAVQAGTETGGAIALEEKLVIWFCMRTIGELAGKP